MNTKTKTKFAIGIVAILIAVTSIAFSQGFLGEGKMNVKQLIKNFTSVKNRGDLPVRGETSSTNEPERSNKRPERPVAEETRPSSTSADNELTVEESTVPAVAPTPILEKVYSNVSSFNPDNGEMATIQFVSNTVGVVRANVRRSDSNALVLVRTIEHGLVSQGVLNNITWDGRDSAGNFVPAGSYAIEIALYETDSSTNYLAHAFASVSVARNATAPASLEVPVSSESSANAPVATTPAPIAPTPTSPTSPSTPTGSVYSDVPSALPSQPVQIEPQIGDVSVGPTGNNSAVQIKYKTNVENMDIVNRKWTATTIVCTQNSVQSDRTFIQGVANTGVENTIIWNGQDRRGADVANGATGQFTADCNFLINLVPNHDTAMKLTEYFKPPERRRGNWVPAAGDILASYSGSFVLRRTKANNYDAGTFEVLSATYPIVPPTWLSFPPNVAPAPTASTPTILGGRITVSDVSGIYYEAVRGILASGESDIFSEYAFKSSVEPFVVQALDIYSEEGGMNYLSTVSLKYKNKDGREETKSCFPSDNQLATCTGLNFLVSKDHSSTLKIYGNASTDSAGKIYPKTFTLKLRGAEVSGVFPNTFNAVGQDFGEIIQIGQVSFDLSGKKGVNIAHAARTTYPVFNAIPATYKSTINKRKPSSVAGLVPLAGFSVRSANVSKSLAINRVVLSFRKEEDGGNGDYTNLKLVRCNSRILCEDVTSIVEILGENSYDNSLKETDGIFAYGSNDVKITAKSEMIVDGVGQYFILYGKHKGENVTYLSTFSGVGMIMLDSCPAGSACPSVPTYFNDTISNISPYESLIWSEMSAVAHSASSSDWTNRNGVYPYSWGTGVTDDNSPQLNYLPE